MHCANLILTDEVKKIITFFLKLYPGIISVSSLLKIQRKKARDSIIIF